MASVIRMGRRSARKGKNGKEKKKNREKVHHLRLKFMRGDNSRQQVGSIDFSTAAVEARWFRGHSRL